MTGGKLAVSEKTFLAPRWGRPEVDPCVKISVLGALFGVSFDYSGALELFAGIAVLEGDGWMVSIPLCSVFKILEEVEGGEEAVLKQSEKCECMRGVERKEYSLLNSIIQPINTPCGCMHPTHPRMILASK